MADATTEDGHILTDGSLSCPTADTKVNLALSSQGNEKGTSEPTGMACTGCHTIIRDQRFLEEWDWAQEHLVDEVMSTFDDTWADDN